MTSFCSWQVHFVAVIGLKVAAKQPNRETASEIINKSAATYKPQSTRYKILYFICHISHANLCSHEVSEEMEMAMEIRKEREKGKGRNWALANCCIDSINRIRIEWWSNDWHDFTLSHTKALDTQIQMQIIPKIQWQWKLQLQLQLIFKLVLVLVLRLILLLILNCTYASWPYFWQQTHNKNNNENNLQVVKTCN